MAGILDWLSEAIGGSGSMLPPDQTTNGMRPTPGQTFQRPEFAGPQGGQPPMPMPPPPPGPGIGSDAARAPQQPPMPSPPPTPMGPDSPQNPTGGPVPMPMGRPPEAGPGAPPKPDNRGPLQWTPPPIGSSGAAAAPSVAPGGGAVPGGADVPGAMASYKAAGGTMEPPATAPGNGPQARGILGRALGLDPNTERRLSGGLAAGLTAAGNSSGKSPFQALASGAGATLSGGDQADDKTELKQERYLRNKIESDKLGDSRELNLARVKLLEAQTQMTSQGKMGKDSVMNSDAQLYLRAQGATNQDANLKILKSQYDAITKDRGPSSPEAKAALDAYQKSYEDTLNSHLGRLGLDPKTASKIGKQPGMSQENPIGKEKLTSQEAFDKLPPGAFFVNPKDGKVLQKPLAPIAKPAAGPAGGQTLPAGQGGTPAPQPASNLPPLPPSTPTASAITGFGADEDAEEKEPA